jgi:hypothetical protein
MDAENSGSSILIECRPSEDGFTVWIGAPIGQYYMFEYHVVGSGGYQESGRVSGTISSRPEIVRCRVGTSVVVAAITAAFVGRADEIRIRSLSEAGNARPALEGRAAASGQVDAVEPADGARTLPRRDSK